jgi:hypothetical protein
MTNIQYYFADILYCLLFQVNGENYAFLRQKYKHVHAIFIVSISMNYAIKKGAEAPFKIILPLKLIQ